jgi:excisionase family DNA binding protein
MKKDNTLQAINTDDKFSENLLFNKLKWMNSQEASAYLNTSVGSIRNMVYRGQLPAKKLGNRLRFKMNDLDFILNNSYSKRNSK